MMARRVRPTTRITSGKSVKTHVSHWLHEVALVLQKPTVTIALFALGFIFVVIASRQVKMALGVLDRYGIHVLDGDSILSYFLVVIVFFFVWLDVLIVLKLHKIVMTLLTFVHGHYLKVIDRLESSARKEEAKLYRNLKTTAAGIKQSQRK